MKSFRGKWYVALYYSPNIVHWLSRYGVKFNIID